MSLWNPRKPLNQPPHFGRVAVRDEFRKDPAEEAAKVAHHSAQFARYEKTSRLGLRAVVKE